jgi:Tfp pilus assembly protein PilF
VDKYPNEPDVRNTRGTILVKLGRWEEGVKDLEFALPQLRVKGQTHASLALAYRNLGMSQLAAEHERLARELSAPRADDASRRPEPAPAKP